MQTIKIITENDYRIFEKETQKYLNNKYKIHSSFCGLEYFCDGSTEPAYKAILIKDE